MGMESQQTGASKLRINNDNSFSGEISHEELSEMISGEVSLKTKFFWGENRITEKRKTIVSARRATTKHPAFLWLNK